MQSKPAKTNIHYIDNLRVLMTVLVILHHTLIAYGAPGGWYFTDATSSQPAIIVMTLLVATNQSFFMGFFFFLAALFTEPSYHKKGMYKFGLDRLKRLGIPLLFYSFILGPCMNFLVYRYGLHKEATFLQYLGGYDDWIDFGVLWFVAALLLFTLVYVLVKQTAGPKPQKPIAFPHTGQIVAFAIGLGVVSYLVRIVFPVGWVLHPVGFQLGHFPQYISLFCLGIIAYRNGWMKEVPYRTAKTFAVTALGLVFIVLPIAIVLMNGQLEKVMGGGTWQSFIVAVWEQLTGVSIIVALSGMAKQRWNYTTAVLQKASRAAFATYIFHPLVVISLTLLLLQWKIDPAVKVLIAAPCAVALSFCLGWLITKLPLAKNIV